VNYYFKYSDVAKAELLVWKNVDGELTEENATIVDMAYVNASRGYGGQSMDYAAKEYGTTIFACARFTDSKGDYHYSDMIAYSPEAYAANQISKTTTKATLKALCERMVIYGEAARINFGG